jgi:predicted anti-sigma-YlaC factor YlaD
MMTCRELTELLLDFVSGDLPQEKIEHIQDHLNDCPPCVAILNTYRLTIQMTRRLPCSPLPPTCEQRLRAVVAEQWKQQPSSNA